MSSFVAVVPARRFRRTFCFGIAATALFIMTMLRPAVAQSEFEQKWQALILAAQKEGELVVLFGGGAGRVFGPPLQHFGKKFGIRVIAPPGSGTPLTNRILAERQAGRYTADVIHMSLDSVSGRLIPAGVLDDLRPELIHPEVTNESLWYKGHHWWADKDHKYYFIHAARTRNSSLEMRINTNLVTEADVAKVSSVWDMLEDKWKGKFVALPPTNAGAGQTWAAEYFNPYVGKEWLTRFITEMKVNFVNDVRQIGDGMATGRYSVAINVGAAGNDIDAMTTRGMPLAIFEKPLKEPGYMSTSGQGMIGIASNRPHPNATRLFVNWWLSREGQTIVQTMTTENVIQSMREDGIPLDNTKESERRVPGVNYWFPMADNTYLEGMEEARLWAAALYRATR
jgi:iron(III) transport system substrate-binding protein